MALSKIRNDSLEDTAVHGRRNLIINGAFQVAQRGTSSTSDSYRTVDRTRTNHGGASVTQTQQTLSSGSPYDEGFRYFYRVANTAVSSATSANMQMFQFIEAQNIASSGWQYTSSSSYVTFSAWVRSSLAGTYMFRLRSFDGTAQNYASKFTLAADTWTKITKTVPGNSNLQFDNDTGRGLEVNVSIHFGTDFTSSSFVDDAWAAFDSGSRSDDFDQNWCNTASATFDTTGWQLEVGEHATPFEHRSFADELRRCQRYHYRRDITIYDVAAMGHVLSTNRGAYLLQIPTAMRAKPACSQGSNIHCWYSAGGAVTTQDNLVVVYMDNDATEFNQVYIMADANSSLASVGHPLALTSYHSSGTADSHVSLDSEL